LLSRYVAAVNNHDSAAVDSCIDENYLDDGNDKQIYMEQLGSAFEEYPSLTMSVQKISEDITGDLAYVIINMDVSLDSLTQMSMMDSTYCIRRTGLWYIYGNQKVFRAETFIVRFSDNNQYYAEMFLDDPAHRATTVTLTGTGLSQPQTLSYNIYGSGRWWGPTIPLGTTTPPPVPVTYNFEAVTADSVYTLTVSTSDYFGDFAEPIYPLSDDTVSGSSFTFVWHPVPGDSSIEYGIQLDDHFWQVSAGYDTTLTYDGPPLSAGLHHYYISARPEEMESHSLASMTFIVK
jgi:hypothetical protein